ncbi:MAG: MBL fold metallo-hydrolase [Micropepsaceae bacterium]
MRVSATILGCGSSGGVPRVGGPDGAGAWGVCDPKNPKNVRTRCSLLVRLGETSVLVDTSPDLRQQLLSAHVTHLDAVLMTHAHADQTNGIDDLRPLVQLTRTRIDMYADATTLKRLHQQFGYCFTTPDGSEYPPIINAHEIPEPFEPFGIDGAGGALPILPIVQTHGRIRSLGFRFGPLAYSSDVNVLDDKALEALQGVECWIVDALRYRAHPSHANVETALSWIARVRPKRAILTNLHNDLDFETLCQELPPGVEPAYDGMSVEL